MREVTCESCNREDTPLNNSVKVDRVIYCNSCFNKKFPEKKDLKDKLVETEYDPTICVKCSKDFGRTVLNKISDYPICEDCAEIIKNRSFPNWVKLFFVGILAIVVFSFYWNWRFYSSYSNIKKTALAIQNYDYTHAANLMQTASEQVPEVDDIKVLASFYKGLSLLYSDKSTEALTEFEKCKDKLPDDYNLYAYTLQAKMGSGFDNKDYNLFLSASKDFLRLDSVNAMPWASVASAYACLYAQTGVDSLKVLSDKFIGKAKMIDNASKNMLEYYNRIDHRISTRKILSSAEFMMQFPNGWVKNK